MPLNRRAAMKLGAAALLAGALPGCGSASYAPRPDGWRRFQVTTRLAIPREGAAAQAWVPVPAVAEPGWMRPGETVWQTDAAHAALKTDAETGARFLHAVWPAGDAPATLDVTSMTATQDRSVDLTQPRPHPPLPPAERARFTAPTELIPTGGIVAETAAAITAGARSDLEKARRIYDWVVVNTARNPETRGCGLGDIASMLMMGDLTGKCADLNALYVGLARASGLPARDVYGLRVAPSEFGYESLGAGSSDVTGAQHCRAEVFLSDFGWVPVDPADVRKVMLEEEARELHLRDPKVRAARSALFGAWEGNWVAFNFAHDVDLPGADGPELPFLMYPQAEIAGERRDALDPDGFAYTITAREVRT